MYLNKFVSFYSLSIFITQQSLLAILKLYYSDLNFLFHFCQHPPFQSSSTKNCRPVFTLFPLYFQAYVASAVLCHFLLPQRKQLVLPVDFFNSFLSGSWSYCFCSLESVFLPSPVFFNTSRHFYCNYLILSSNKIFACFSP